MFYKIEKRQRMWKYA